MSLAATLPAAILETILLRLSALFLTGAGGDLTAARQAAYQMLSVYHPETGDELALAANIISFGFQALEALAQAAEPDLSMTRVLRLRGSAVSLNRQAEKARRSLAQSQKSRHQGDPAEAPHAGPEPAQPSSIQPTPVQPAQADAPCPPTKMTIGALAKAKGLTWTQAYQQHHRDARLAARAKQRTSNPLPPAAEAHLSATAQAI